LDRPQIFTGGSEAVFLGVDVESPLGQVEVASLEIRVQD